MIAAHEPLATRKISKVHVSNKYAETASRATRVRNTESRAGDEVVQLYLRDVVSSVTRP